MNWKNLTWKMFMLIAFGAILFVWLIKAPVMSWYLTNVVKLRMSVATISMFPNETTMRYMQIHNPPGFGTRQALEVKKIQLRYKLKQLRAEPSIIDLLELDDVDLLIDCQNPLCTVNNWEQIGRAMPRPVKSPENSGEPKQQYRDGFIIHRIVLNNINVQIKGIETAIATDATNIPENQHIDHLELKNVNSKDGFPTAFLVSHLFKQAGLTKYLNGAFDAPDGAIKSGLKGIFSDEE